MYHVLRPCMYQAHSPAQTEIQSIQDLCRS
jgi:hypothetical protein